MTTSRERILDAYADVLTDEGERHATLEAVAARAGVSKGGLLYHFPSKDQLAEALCDRLVALAAEDVEEMRTSADGPARHYIRTSHYADTPLDRTFVAVARLQQAGDPRARAAIRQISAHGSTRFTRRSGTATSPARSSSSATASITTRCPARWAAGTRRARSTRACWP